MVAFGVHWMLRKSAARKLWLLAASYAFYACWDWRFLGLILVSTLADFVAGGTIDRADPETEAGRLIPRRPLGPLGCHRGTRARTYLNLTWPSPSAACSTTRRTTAEVADLREHPARRVSPGGMLLERARVT